jgi:four helix bundle protein
LSTIERFEDIIAWQEARKLCDDVYSLTRKASFKNDYSLRNQIRRAASSVMLNIAEGFARRSDNGFKHFLYIARGSSAEVQSVLYIALDQKYITSEEFSRLYEKSNEVSRIITGLIKYLREKIGK